MAIILGVETSCDETAAAVYDTTQGLLSHTVHSQIEIHQAFGGVVPELASRDHIKKLLPVVRQALTQAHIIPRALDGIAYTRGPGLMGALMVGASLAKGIALSLDVPAIGIHHLEAHLMVAMLEAHKPDFPFLSLLVSGGHTMLIKVESFGHYTLLGESLDDAVGEAFDKTAKLLGLPYPGGPHLERLARSGVRGRFQFPRAMIRRTDLNFSFSGIKTFAVNCVQQIDLQNQTDLSDLAADFQYAIIDALLIKTKQAIAQTQLDQLVVAGGVSANLALRQFLQDALTNVDIFYPSLKYCTDNAAMIAYTGALRFDKSAKRDLTIDAKSRWPITDLDR
jgi:N6-L-threonylcarbamoyladenine synthase